MPATIALATCRDSKHTLTACGTRKSYYLAIHTILLPLDLIATYNTIQITYLFLNVAEEKARPMIISTVTRRTETCMS